MTGTQIQKISGGRKILKSKFIALILLLSISSCIFKFKASVPTDSMAPTIAKGDEIGLVSCFSRLRNCKPKRGEIYSFKFPANKNVTYFKRVIGIPGDRIRIVDDTLYLNDKLVKSEFVGEFQVGGNKCEKKYEFIGKVKYTICVDPTLLSKNRIKADIRLSQNQFFFLSDNRDYSIDSRHFGPISYFDITARVVKKD